MAGVYKDAISSIPDARLRMVCGSAMERASAVANDPAVEATTQFAKVIESSDVDAIIIANQPQRHGVAVDAINSGRHVLVEKPLAATLDDAAAILAASRNSNAVVSGVFQMRLGRDVEKLVELVSSGRIGDVRGMDALCFDRRSDAYYRSGNGWRLTPCGGLILNRLIHHIDLMRSLLGEVQSVFATTRSSDDNPMVDVEATIVLDFTDGQTGVIRGFDTTGSANMLTVYGDRGAVQLRDGDVYASDDAVADALLPGRKANLRRAIGWGRERSRWTPGGAREQLVDFLGAIERDQSPRVSIEDSYRALAVALAAHESAASGCAVVVDVDEAGSVLE